MLALTPLMVGCLHAPATAAEPKPTIAVTYVSRFGGDIDASQTNRVSLVSLAPEGAPRDLGVVEVIARAEGVLCSAGRWSLAGQAVGGAL